MRSIDEWIEAIRRAFKGDGEPRTLIGQLIESEGARALRPLLVSFIFSEENSDELYCLTHAVESFPDEIYLRSLSSSAVELGARNPSFLDFLVSRVLNSDKAFPKLLNSGRSWSTSEFSAIIESLRRIEMRYDLNPRIAVNSREAIKDLARTR